MSTLAFTVLGTPQPAGSKKGYVNPKTGKVIITDAAKGSRPWKQQVAGEALARTNGTPFAGPVELALTFFVARPKAHYGTGRNAAKLKPTAPRYPTTRPDATKLLRAVEDALTGIVYADDAQVINQYVSKLYGSPERVEIAVCAMPGSTEAGRAAA